MIQIDKIKKINRSSQRLHGLHHEGGARFPATHAQNRVSVSGDARTEVGFYFRRLTRERCIIWRLTHKRYRGDLGPITRDGPVRCTEKKAETETYLALIPLLEED
ncbi:hypothetical protein RND81_01G059700 [Saponaria officinalis]|uniref:Uncharacterized protein n=1 Tax=Saponaria officinalis TaxID=3572 RepID=A0AAW1N5Y6_SAPOF